MTAFEEDFPSLRGEIDENGLISECAVELHCLDKAKVREAFEPLMDTIRRGTVPSMDTAREVWKNLQNLGL